MLTLVVCETGPFVWNIDDPVFTDISEICQFLWDNALIKPDRARWKRPCFLENGKITEEATKSAVIACFLPDDAKSFPKHLLAFDLVYENPVVAAGLWSLQRNFMIDQTRDLVGKKGPYMTGSLFFTAGIVFRNEVLKEAARRLMDGEDALERCVQLARECRSFSLSLKNPEKYVHEPASFWA